MPFWKLKTSYFFLPVSALFFYVLLIVCGRSVKPLMVERPLYFAPPQAIKHFAFGFEEVWADLLWLRLIQDMDFCSGEQGLPVYTGQKKYRCQKGWSYRMTDALTELAPRFFAPYLTASSIMSVIMGDKEGARRIYDKGLMRFPKNRHLHFHAGYHYLLELKEEKRGTELLLQAARLGGPEWLYGLVVKKYRSFGKLRLAKEILEEFSKRDTKGAYHKIIREKLRELEEALKLPKQQKKPLI